MSFPTIIFQLYFQVRNISLCQRLLSYQNNGSNVVEEGTNGIQLQRDIIDSLGISQRNSEEETDAFRPAWPRNYSS